MRINYQPLNEAQLHRLLQGYNLGRKSPPYCWLPPPEDRHQAMQDGRRLLNIKIYTASALYYYNGYLSSREIILFYCFTTFAEDILLEMSGHPPFLFPQDCGVIDLAHPPDDKEFWTHFKKLYTQYGVAEGLLPFLKIPCLAWSVHIGVSWYSRILSRLVFFL